jgi:hypothetical protein
MTMTRAAALGLAALAGYAAVVMTVPGRASATTAYRYWAYYVAHGSTWQYSQRGPASEYPADGEVQGWRFAVQVDAANGLLPGARPDFTTLCAATPAKAGNIRVGVVIDFGIATDAPAHEKPPAAVVPGCVSVHDGATGADVLEAAGVVRIGTGADAGLVCGIDGYPKTECAVAVAAPEAPPAPAPPVAAAPAAAPSAAATPSPTSPRAIPTATASTHPPAATPDPPPTNAPVGSAAATSLTASSDVAGAAQSSAPVAALAQSALPAPASASPLSLAALRSSAHHSNGVPATTIAGIALIAIIGGAAIWRAKVRGR